MSFEEIHLMMDRILAGEDVEVRYMLAKKVPYKDVTPKKLKGK